MELKKAFNSRIGNKKVQIPLHWNDYPKIVMGAIDASMELCKDRILKSQIRPAVIDVIVNRKKVLHCKNEYQVAHTSLRRYVYYACNFLLRCLGSTGVNLVIQPYINSLTTYKQVQRLFSNKGILSSCNHSQSADVDEFEDDEDDDDDLDDLVSEEPSAADGICLALQGSLQSANMLTQEPTNSYSTPFRPANAWEQIEQDEVVEFKPLMLSPSKTLLNRPIVRIAEEDSVEQNSVSSATSSGLRLPSLAKKLPKVYDSSNMDYFNWDNPDVVEHLQRLKNKQIKVRHVASYFKERYNKTCAQKTIYRHLPKDVSIEPYINKRGVGAETLGKSRQIQDLIRAGRFIDGISAIDLNFPDFMQDQRELGLFLKIQKLAEQGLILKKLNAQETMATKVKENGDTSDPTTSTLLQTIDQGLAENVSKKISNEEGLAIFSTGAQNSKTKDDRSLEAVQKCELLSEMGHIAKTIASLLVDGKANGVIATSSLKEASRRVNDAFAVILDNQSISTVPENAAYLMANSQWEKLADFFNMALFAHTKLQLTLDLFKD
uniref:Uncharacterized protein n=2 Tax=Ditylenchus dipsaci TaxID=166011 RepID=A0A915D1X2_9BILA